MANLTFLALTPDLTLALTLNPNLPYTALLLTPPGTDITDGVYTQYTNAINFLNLLAGLEPLLIIRPLDFYYNYFNIDTCTGDGLDNWGRILDISRTVNTPDLTNVIGFNNGSPLEDNQYPCNFNMGNFYGNQVTANVLNDEDFRSLLKLRYAYITTNATLDSANTIMNIFVSSIGFGNKCQVREVGPMQIEFNFNLTLTFAQRAILYQPGLLPVPASVAHVIHEDVPL